MPGTGLAQPGSTGELYLGRSADIARGRPLMTGDVFEGVADDPDDPEGLAMIIAHPCSMRGAAGRLAPRISVAPVRPYQSVPFRSWPEGHFKVMPLPSLRGDDDQLFHAVHLLELTTVRSEQLNRVRRLLALTDRGIHVLQQRLVYSLTRVEVGLEKLQEQSAHVLLEAELEEEWVDELAASDDDELIEASSVAFSSFMDEGHRSALTDPTRRSDAVRSVRAELRRRASGSE